MTPSEAPRQSYDEHVRLAQQPAKPFVRPLGVYVARKTEFELLSSPDLAAWEVAQLAFATLPLHEHGWTDANTTIAKLAGDKWRMRRK